MCHTHTLTNTQSGETAVTIAKRKELEAKSAAAVSGKGSVFYKVTVKVCERVMCVACCVKMCVCCVFCHVQACILL